MLYTQTFLSLLLFVSVVLGLLVAENTQEMPYLMKQVESFRSNIHISGDRCHKIHPSWKRELMQKSKSQPQFSAEELQRYFEAAKALAYYSKQYTKLYHVFLDANILYVNKTKSDQEIFDPTGHIHAALIMVIKAMCHYQFPKRVEFFLNAADHPLDNPFIFSWAKKADSKDTFFPYWSFLYMDKDRLTGIRRNSSWHNKAPVAIWRGSLTGDNQEQSTFQANLRVQLVKMCAANLSFCDAKLALSESAMQTMPWYREVEAYVGMSVAASENHLSMNDVCQKYKYIIVLDGNTAPSSRLVALAYCNSLLLIQQSPWREFWYGGLQPFVHFVPIEASLSDVIDKIKWAQEHPLEVEQIIANMNEYAEQYLNNEASICFMSRQLHNYFIAMAPLFKQSKRLKSNDFMFKYAVSPKHYLAGNCLNKMLPDLMKS
jgi:hypothetical protein